MFPKSFFIGNIEDGFDLTGLVKSINWGKGKVCKAARKIQFYVNILKSECFLGKPKREI